MLFADIDHYCWDSSTCQRYWVRGRSNIKWGYCFYFFTSGGYLLCVISGIFTSVSICFAEFSFLQRLSETSARWSATWTLRRTLSMQRFYICNQYCCSNDHGGSNMVEKKSCSHFKAIFSIKKVWLIIWLERLLQVDIIKAYLVFRKTPKELETRWSNIFCQTCIDRNENPHQPIT